MADGRPMKRTVAIHPLLDSYIRETWALMVKDPDVSDPTCSAALNFMLVGAVIDASQDGGWTDDAREAAWGFASDRETVERLGLEERLSQFREQLRREEGLS